MGKCSRASRSVSCMTQENTPPGPIFKARLLRTKHDSNTNRLVFGKLAGRPFQRHPVRDRHGNLEVAHDRRFGQSPPPARASFYFCAQVKRRRLRPKDEGLGGEDGEGEDTKWSIASVDAVGAVHTNFSFHSLADAQVRTFA